MLQLSIIIVNYNSKEYICDCLASACQFSSVKDFEWIIVDNKSADNSKEEILNLFPFVKWIDMGYNSGFARANNAGILQSQGTTVLLLNPDTIILNDSINKCLNRFLNGKEIACSVQLINPDGSSQITGNYFMTGIPTKAGMELHSQRFRQKAGSMQTDLCTFYHPKEKKNRVVAIL